MPRKPFRAVPLRAVVNAPWRPARGAGARRPRGGDRRFAALLVALPLAAFSAVFLWHAPPPAAAGPAATMAASGEAPRPRGWDTDPAALDAAQPDTAAAFAPARTEVASRFAPGRDRESANFGLCNGMGRAGGNCVIDGDTLWYAGEKIRVADINAPEASAPGCPREAALGARATTRFLALLNAGPFTLAPNGDGTGRERDKYGRALRVVTRGGRSLGGTLVAEGLAEAWRGYRREWC